MAKFILHVWTKDAATRKWVVHVLGQTYVVKNVVVWVPMTTRTDQGDLDANGNPCAHWYLEGEGRCVATVDGETMYVFKEPIYDEAFPVTQPEEGSVVEEAGDSSNS